MNRLHVFGKQPYWDTDERLLAVEGLRLKLVNAEKIRKEWHDRLWKIGGGVLIFGFLWLFWYGYATRF